MRLSGDCTCEGDYSKDHSYLQLLFMPGDKCQVCGNDPVLVLYIHNIQLTELPKKACADLCSTIRVSFLASYRAMLAQSAVMRE